MNDIASLMLEVLKDFKDHIGDSEYNDMPEIQSWIKETSGNIHREAWCADSLNHFLRKHGIPGTGSPAAASFLNWGIDIGDQAVDACVAVFQWSRGPDAGGHHVTLVDDDQEGVPDGYIACVGGNQSKSVSRAKFPLNDVVSFRMPECT
jgi:uncharacterized protein (TIGR02594 family)